MPATLSCFNRLSVHRSSPFISCATPTLGWKVFALILFFGGGMSICRTAYIEVYIYLRSVYIFSIYSKELTNSRFVSVGQSEFVKEMYFD